MPRVSVVVPIYEVGAYLAECLQSLARQTVSDLEVIMVDDGSTDGSVPIAQRFARHDPRFVLIRQANGGLGHARNTGARAASGEYLAFADSDDVLPSTAYERLLGALDASGSDFATGNVCRLTRAGVTQAPFLRTAFARDRQATHVTKHRALLADRTAWNKLFRRSFWDAHRLSFPEGVLHEDIPVTLPAHFRARAVDVVGAPVYHWRVREGGERSITQRRLEHRTLRDRLAAVEEVASFIAVHGPRRANRWYQAQLARDDLRLHLNLLHEADPVYREEFLRRARALLDGLPVADLAGLPAVDRVKWHLAIAGHEAELLDLLRFQARHGAAVAPARRLGRWYGDYPHRGDTTLGVPASAYRLGRVDADLALEASVDAVDVAGGTLRVDGRAHLGGFGAPAPDAQRVQLSLVRADRWQAVRSRVAPVRLDTSVVARPDETASFAWSGWRATLDARVAAPAGGWKPGRYTLHAHVRRGGLSRRRTRFELGAADVAQTVHLRGPDDLLLKLTVDRTGQAALDVRDAWLRTTGHELAPGQVLRLSGEGRLPDGEHRLVVERRSDRLAVDGELRVTGDRWEADVPLTPLRAAAPSLQRADDAHGVQETWQVLAVGPAGRVPLELEPHVPLAAWSTARHAVSLVATASREAALAVQDRTAVTTLPAPVPAPVVRRAPRPSRARV